MKTKYTPKFMDKVCAGIAGGRSLASVCSELDVSPQTVHRWRRDVNLPDAEVKYQNARQDLSWLIVDMGLDEVEKTKQADNDLESKKITAREHRAIVRGCETRYRILSHMAGKLHPTQFGDRQQVALTGASGGPVEGKIVVEFVAPKPEDGDNG